MKEKIFATGNDWTGLILRLTLGLVLFPHGAQKLLGWFGGYGFTNTMNGLSGMGIPAIVALLVIVLEFFGALALIFGFASRIWSIGLFGLFMGIIVKVHSAHGFFMNWAGTQAGEGFEYHLLVLGIAAAILLNGSGKFSIDGLITGERSERLHLSKVA